MNQFFGEQKKTCSKIPTVTKVYYDAAKMDGIKKKILEFNAELNVMEGQDLIYFESLCKVLENTQTYNRSEVSPQQVKLIDKLLAFPLDKAFPCADLYRVYLMHPTAYEPFAGSDAGISYIQGLIRLINSTNNPKNLILCTLRAINNLFKNMSSQHVAFINRQKIVDAVTPHLVNADKLVRQAGITLLMNYSSEFLSKEDQEGRIQVISALATCINQETDLQNLLRTSIALGNCAYKCSEAQNLISTIGIQFPPESQIVSAGETDAEAHKKTIREIKAMLLNQ